MSIFKQVLGNLGPLSKLFGSSDNQLVSWLTEAQNMSSNFLKQAEAEQVNLNDIPVQSSKGTQSLQSIIEGLKDQLLPLIQQFMKNPNPAQLTSLLSNNASAIDGIKKGLSSGNLSQLLGPNLAKQLQGLLSHFDKIPKIGK
jgi:hypothetical protein